MVSPFILQPCKRNKSKNMEAEAGQISTESPSSMCTFLHYDAFLWQDAGANIEEKEPGCWAAQRAKQPFLLQPEQW